MSTTISPLPARARRVPATRRRARWLNEETVTAYAFLLVPMLLFVLIKFYPVFYNVFLSFTNYDMFSPLEFVGLKNYRDVVTQEVTQKAIRNTVLFAAGAVPLGTILALVMAELLNKRIRGRILFRILYYLPFVTPIVAASYVWKLILNPQIGLMNHLLGYVGVPPQQWLSDPQLAMPSLIGITIWAALGGNLVIFLAGLQDIPPDLYEAADIDGAEGWQKFVYITVPLLRPVLLFVVVTFSIGIFRSFGLIFVLTQGGPSLTTNTLVWEVYQNAFGYLRFGKAAAISMVLLVTILAITAINFRLFREEGT